MQREALVDWLDYILDSSGFQDKSLNGLQIEGREEVNHLAVATDACQATIDAAVAAGVDMLIVHHGLFWGRCERIRGAHGRRVRAAIKADLNVYASHLPLDAHHQLGNNAELARLLRLQDAEPWGGYDDQTIGFAGRLVPALSRQALAARLREILGAQVRVLPFGTEPIERVAVVSGDAVAMADQALHEGFDAFVTGETRYGSYFLSEESGLPIFFAGHYATETLGVKALARHIEAEHGLPWTFIDHPTGM